MVPDNSIIINKLIHHSGFNLPPVDIEKQSALHSIPRINQQHILMHAPDAVNNHLTTRNPP